MTSLVDVEEPLALFAEGITGRYYHIKSVDEYSGSRMVFDPARGTLTGDALLLPETVEMEDPACYRVLALEQLSIAEFGTLDFSIAEARRRIPALEPLDEPLITDRASDFERFFNHVRRPYLLSRLFALCERVRLNAHLRHQYPGIRRRVLLFRFGAQDRYFSLKFFSSQAFIGEFAFELGVLPRERFDLRRVSARAGATASATGLKFFLKRCVFFLDLRQAQSRRRLCAQVGNVYPAFGFLRVLDEGNFAIALQDFQPGSCG